MIPTMWHEHPSYGHSSYDPVWAACAEAGLVVHTHSGEADTEAYNDNMAQYMLEVAFWTHRPLWQLLLSGKFDQFPNLRVRARRVRVVVGRRPLVQDRRDVRRPELEGEEDGFSDEGPHRAAPVRVHRHQRVHRGLGHEQARAPPPIRQRSRRPHVGHRLPPPRGHVAKHDPAAVHRLPGDPGRGDASAPRAQRRALLRPRRRCPRRHRRRHRPDPRPNSTRISTCGPRPTRSARPASGSTTTASNGRTDEPRAGRSRLSRRVATRPAPG